MGKLFSSISWTMGNLAQKLAKIFPWLTRQLHNLPAEARGKKICGSTPGWLIMVDNNSRITLLNTTTRAQILLPRIPPLADQDGDNLDSPKTQNYVVHKAVLSLLSRFRLCCLIIYGKSKQLAYYHSSTNSWTFLQEAGCHYDDIVCHDKELYAVDEYGKVVLCEPYSAPAIRVITERWFFWGHKVHILSVGEDLCLVVRYLDDRNYSDRETYLIKAYFLEVTDKWERTSWLEDWIILLGHNHSLALQPGKIEGSMANCIYYKDDHIEAKKNDMRVFVLEDGSVEQSQCSPDDLERVWRQHMVY